MRGISFKHFAASVAGIASAALMALSTPASATDWAFPSLMPASDQELGPVSWTGFIISPDINFNDKLNLSGSGSAFLDDPEGFSIGGKIGYDKQYGDIVLGIVTDGYYSFADAGSSCGCELESELHYWGTVRGRLGYSFGRMMVYGTAGYAYGELEVTDKLLGFSDSEVLSGWAYGGGLEYAWNKDITLRAGYWKVDFDEQTFSSLPFFADKLEADIDVFDFGLVRRY